MIWHIVHNVDTEVGKESIWVRSPFLEIEALDPSIEEYLPSGDKDKVELFERALVNSIEYASKAQSPRIIKTHMPIEMLPPNLLDTCKVVYVCRNPKDTCVSYYHHCRLFADEHPEDFEHFADMFMSGNIFYGSYWSHLKVSTSRLEHIIS